MLPAEVAGWRVRRRIGYGAATEVFLVDRPGSSRRALKRLLPVFAHEADLREAFARETRLLALLDHPNLPRLHEAGESDEVPYLVLDYVDGCSLEALMRAIAAPLPVPVSLALIVGVAEALAHLHELRDERGEALVRAHRDVSPRNVLLARDGRTVLIDFGLVAGAVAARETTRNVVKATWRYAPPEQLRGSSADPRMDVYALGTLLYLLATGERPWPELSDPEALIEAKESGPLLMEPAGPIADLVQRATQVSPRDRPQDMPAVLELLRAEPRATASAVAEALGDTITRVMRIEALAAAPAPRVSSAEERGESVTDPGLPETTLHRPAASSEPGSALFLGLATLLLLAVLATIGVGG